MKKYVLIAAMFAAMGAKAQDKNEPAKENRHKGIQMSFYAGGAFGDVNGKTEELGKTVFRGSVGHVMMQFGYAINDWAFGFAAGTNSMSIKNISVKDSTYSAVPGWTIDNGLVGLYVKRYFMPLDIFVCAEGGLGKFTMYDPDSKPKVESDRSFAWNISAGKEFAIGKKKQWAIGGYINLCGIKCHDLPPYANDTYSFLAPGIGVVVSYR